MDNLPTSKSVESLIDMIGRGRISVAGAVSLANSMVDDGMTHKAITTFASLGTNNVHPGNSERDLFRWLRNVFDFSLEPFSVTMHLQETWC